jgi:hypothetical protein
MILQKFGSIEWLEFEIFQSLSYIKCKIFLKKGGVSQSPRAELNMGFHCGDDPAAVAQNRQLASIDKYVGGLHVHGATVAEVTNTQIREVPSCDALITSLPHIGLITTHADCQTAVFYDPIEHVIANVHCGWRGNVQNIYAHTIDALKNRYGSKPENLLVGVGPSLGPEHSQFINYKTELPESFWDFQVKEGHFNLWEVARMQLMQAGVKNDHIEIAEMCTFANDRDFFSYRRDKICGRHATTVLLF